MDKVLFSHRFNATTSDIEFDANDASQSPIAQSMLALVHPAGAGEGNNSYILAKVPSAGTQGVRFIVADSAGTPLLRLGFHTFSSAGNPLKVSSTAMTYNDWWHIAGSWDGGTAHAGIHIYQGMNGAALAEVSYAASNNGSGTLDGGTGNQLHIGNREGNDRTHNGDIAYVARWDRVLTLDELLVAQRQGPLLVRRGLILFWANGRDYSTSRLMPVRTRTLGTGKPPLFTPIRGRLVPNNFATSVAAAAFKARYYYDMISGRNASV